MKIGILALQGAFLEHKIILDKLGIQTIEIRKKSDLLNNEIDGIILPGGESTVMGKLLRELDIFDLLKEKIQNNLPVFGTCAGLILLAKKIEKQDDVHLACMDIEVLRNAYGRQLGSFETFLDFKGLKKVEAVFIRGPIIKTVGENVDILSTHDDKIVAAREKNMLVTAFHPELTNDYSIHKYFLNMVKEYMNGN